MLGSLLSFPNGEDVVANESKKVFLEQLAERYKNCVGIALRSFEVSFAFVLRQYICKIGSSASPVTQYKYRRFFNYRFSNFS